MIEYKSGERLGFIKKAHTRKSVLVQSLYKEHENNRRCDNHGKCRK